MSSNNKPFIQDALIMAALVAAIVVVVDFSNMMFLDFIIVILALVWILMTLMKWRKRN